MALVRRTVYQLWIDNEFYMDYETPEAAEAAIPDLMTPMYTIEYFSVHTAYRYTEEV